MYMIKDIKKEDRPRERALEVGVSNLSDNELLAIILRSGTRNKSVKELSNELLKMVGSLNKLRDVTYNSLTNINGIGKVKAIELLSIIELSKRINYKRESKRIKIKSSIDVFNNYKYLFIDKKQEYFYVLYLDNKNYVIGNKLLFIGTLNKSLVHPREIFKYAYLNSAAGIICMHNHPSGNITPSNEDIKITNNLIEIGKIQNIIVLDHIIFGNNNYCSIINMR